MENSTKIALSVLCFLICGVIGFFSSRTIKKHTLAENKGKETAEIIYTATDTESVTKDAAVILAADSVQVVEGNNAESASDMTEQKEEPVIAVAEERVVQKVKKMSTAELEGILNSGDEYKAIAANCKERMSSRCRYRFKGINEDEENIPMSYNAIIMNISLGTWASVSVLSASYDEDDRMTSADIQVNY